MKYHLPKRLVGDEDKAASKISPVTEGKLLTQRELDAINGNVEPLTETYQESLIQSLRSLRE